MDCPICYNIIVRSYICSNNHHFCRECLIKWCYFGNNICPKCKVPFFELKSDTEFDNINLELANIKNISLDNNNTNNSDTNTNNNVNFKNLNREKIMIDFMYYKNSQLKPGITICNNTNGCGLKIIKVNKKDIFYQYNIKENDIILFVNEIPCTDHKSFIDIIEYYFINNKILELEILKK